MSGGIDPASSPPVALRGRVVTMDATASVHEDAVVYCDRGTIVEVLPASAAAPDAFADIAVQRTGGTLYPGLIELHNHMPYNVLPLWQVPGLYTNRDRWSAASTPEYKTSITGPIGVLGRQPDVVPAIVRFVEIRALLGGTTTSQGVALAAAHGIVTHFRGLVRNVESTRDPDLPPATTHIPDIDATDAEHFLARISGRQKLLLHLSEGTDQAARDHFTALHLPDDRWAISQNLIGIHCAALTPEDFAVFAAHGGSMVWSPLSNLLLYGKTADVAAAREAGVPIALGADWAPSGSKNLLGELKVARIYADSAGLALTDLDLVRMVTTTPAAMLGWDSHLGSLEPGRRADLIVLDGRSQDPYQQLLTATEADIHLVMINGDARVGTPALMRALGPTDETIRIAGRPRLLNLRQPTADPTVAELTVAEAITRLQSALRALPNISTTKAVPAGAARHSSRDADDPTAPSLGAALLAVSGVIDNHMSSRPHLPLNGRPTGPNFPGQRDEIPGPFPPLLDRRAGATLSSAGFPALRLDPLTAVDNPDYYTALASAPNVPTDIRARLQALSPR